MFRQVTKLSARTKLSQSSQDKLLPPPSSSASASSSSKQKQGATKLATKRLKILFLICSFCSLFIVSTRITISFEKGNDDDDLVVVVDKENKMMLKHYRKIDKQFKRARKQELRENTIQKLLTFKRGTDDDDDDDDGFDDDGSSSSRARVRQLLPGEGVNVFRERVFDPVKNNLAYAHMGTIIANSGRDAKAISIAFQTAPDLEGGFDQTIKIITKKGKGDVWILEEQLPAPAIGEKSQQSVINGNALTRTYSNGLWAPVLHRDDRTKTEYLFYAETPPRCLRPRILPQEFPIPRKAIPKRWIIGGDIKVRMRSFGSGENLEWSKAKTVYRMTTDNVSIPKVIANKLTVVQVNNADENDDREVWLLPFWRQRSPHTCSTARGVRNAAGVLRSTDKGETWKAYGSVQFQTGAKGRWVIEGSIFQNSRDDTLTMLMRSSEGVAFKSLSTDLGMTWSAPLPSALVNPDSKLNTIKNRKTKRLYVAFNDETISRDSVGVSGDDDAVKGTSEDKEQTAGGKKRDELVIGHSDDDGENLYIFARIDEGLTPPGVMIHYPTMAFHDEQELLVTYSISYNNVTNFVETPRRDGIWLARITPPKTIDESLPKRSLRTIVLDINSQTVVS
jgi:hypothetical protein